MRGNTGTPSFFREEYQGHHGACVVVRPVRELISPKRFFTDEKTKFSIDGVRLEVYMIPGESADYVAVWLPDAQALFSGDHVYGSFPNLYPIRGGDYRNVERSWVIESVYEQTIQGMNEGRTADELATSVRLPEAQRNLLCLGDIYGVIPGAAREIFAAKIGWFNGNPTPLVRLTPAEQSARMAILLVEQTFLSAGQGRPRRRETIAGLPFLQSS